MPDVLHTEYGRLFRVSLLHDAWLSRGGVAFERLDATGQRGVVATFDSRRLLRIRPARETAELMGRHALAMIADSGGLLVGARLQRPPGGDPVMQRPPGPDFRLRLLLFLAEAAMPSYSNLPLISGGGFYRFGTLAGNLDPFGAHLSARLRAFDQAVGYRIGDTVVDVPDAPAERSVALRDTGPGPRQAADWATTGALPPADPGPFPPGQIQQGDRIRRDGFVY